MRLQRHTAAAIVKQFSEGSGDEVVCNIAGWRNQDHSGSYLTVELSPRFVARASTEQDDIMNSIMNDRRRPVIGTAATWYGTLSASSVDACGWNSFRPMRPNSIRWSIYGRTGSSTNYPTSARAPSPS